MLKIKIHSDGEPFTVDVCGMAGGYWQVIESADCFTGQEGLVRFSSKQQAEIFAEGIALGLKLARKIVVKELESAFKGMSNGRKETIYT